MAAEDRPSTFGKVLDLLGLFFDMVSHFLEETRSKDRETSSRFSRLLELGKFEVALAGQIRFNTRAQL